MPLLTLCKCSPALQWRPPAKHRTCWDTSLTLRAPPPSAVKKSSPKVQGAHTAHSPSRMPSPCLRIHSHHPLHQLRQLPTFRFSKKPTSHPDPHLRLQSELRSLLTFDSRELIPRHRKQTTMSWDQARVPKATMTGSFRRNADWASAPKAQSS